ncbi:MAG: hypothetical protein WD046_05110 [Paracoccaceae bacterium]
MEDERYEKIWAAYPKDLQRGKAACLARIAEAEKEGVDPDDLLRAVLAYATESAGFTRSKVCFADNWFADRRWQRFLEAMAEERQAQTTIPGWSPKCATAGPCANTSPRRR